MYVTTGRRIEHLAADYITRKGRDGTHPYNGLLFQLPEEITEIYGPFFTLGTENSVCTLGLGGVMP